MKHFIQDTTLLQEEKRDKDLFQFKPMAKALLSRLDAMPNTAIISIIGPYGVGKSALLESVKSQMSRSVTWFQFDAWKYPDRKNLWEGFVLDFTKKVSPKDFKKVLAEIDGTKGNKAEGLTSTLAVASNFILPGAGGAVDKLKYLFTTSPVRRLHEFEELIEKQIEKCENEVYLVLEDVDRSESGILFFETVSYYFRNSSFSKKIRVIAPISSVAYRDETKLHSLEKSSDYFEYFSAENLDVEEFIDTIFTSTLTNNLVVKSQLKMLFTSLLKLEYMTIRKIKIIIRESLAKYDYLVSLGFQPDPVLCMVVQSMKYLRTNDSRPNENYYNLSKRNKYIGNQQLGFINYIVWSNALEKDIDEVKNYIDVHRELRGTSGYIGIDTGGDFSDKPAKAWTASGGNHAARIPSLYFEDFN